MWNKCLKRFVVNIFRICSNSFCSRPEWLNRGLFIFFILRTTIYQIIRFCWFSFNTCKRLCPWWGFRFCRFLDFAVVSGTEISCSSTFGFLNVFFIIRRFNIQFMSFPFHIPSLERWGRQFFWRWWWEFWWGFYNFGRLYFCIWTHFRLCLFTIVKIFLSATDFTFSLCTSLRCLFSVRPVLKPLSHASQEKEQLFHLFEHMNYQIKIFWKIFSLSWYCRRLLNISLSAKCIQFFWAWIALAPCS